MGSDGEDEKKEKERERRKRLAVSPISKPLAGKKLTKKTLKVVKKGRGKQTNNAGSFWNHGCSCHHRRRRRCCKVYVKESVPKCVSKLRRMSVWNV
jgi:hypothetical protein